MNQFVFRPTGQGLFYTGTIANGSFKFVYDCGTENEQKLLNKQIQSYWQENKRDDKQKPLLDFVVVSHLHKDHYSGLWELIKCFEVKKIYLPYLNCFTKDVLRLQLYYDLMLENASETKINTASQKLYRLMEKLCGLDDSYARSEHIGQIEYVQDKQTVRSLDDENRVWQFEFIYNKAENNKIKKLNEKCNEILQGANCTSMKEFLEKNANEVNMIAKAYKQVFGQGSAINNTSILLLHYPLSQRGALSYDNFDDFDKSGMNDYDRNLCCRCRERRVSDVTTLLTGDITFHRAIAEKMKIETVSVLQVPHHGSKANWKALRKCKIKSKIYLIPFGYGNRYRHPNINVIDDLILNKEEFYCVTQNQGFFYYID